MKRILIACCVLIKQVSFGQDTLRNENPNVDSFYILAPVSVRAVRAGEKTPFTKTNLSKKEIQFANQGVDLPFILNNTPSIVVNSDAGNGIGYTGMRIRGTDATRINITLNGIPFNDAESQGTFFCEFTRLQLLCQQHPNPTGRGYVVQWYRSLWSQRKYQYH